MFIQPLVRSGWHVEEGLGEVGVPVGARFVHRGTVRLKQVKMKGNLAKVWQRTSHGCEGQVSTCIISWNQYSIL